MRRTKQAAVAQSRHRKPKTAGSKSNQLISLRPIALYGHAAWEVSPAHEPCSALGTPSSGEAVGPLGLQAINTNPAKTARRRHERRREHRVSVRRAKTSAREIKTDFTFLIGVANAVAFEGVLFLTLWLVWYGVSSLSSATFL